VRRGAPTRDDIVGFKPVIIKTSELLLLSVVVVGDRGYDSGENHIRVREKLDAFSVIP